ncbi:MAG: hypothetical protein JXX14_07745 [Deltaproteobacteria bacterium]|nr:hypothetical protein [Deltaproteobacteria bacterium]
MNSLNATAAAMFLLSFALVLFELLLTRLFGVVLFAQFAHLALALALLGISIGAVIQHLWPDIIPDKGFERRLAMVALVMGAAMLLAVLCTTVFPITEQFEKPPLRYQERSNIQGRLLNEGWFGLLLPLLMLPFVCAGLAFSGAFYRRKAHIGYLYGADLIGGAIGALAFIPLLGNLAGPDVVFAAILAAILAAVGLFFVNADKKWWLGSLGAGALVLILLTVAAFGGEVMKIHFAAGYSEKNISYTQWTPLTRLAVHRNERGTYVLLDNSSASEVILTEKDRNRKAQDENRSLVYRLHDPPAKIAILASSAGPEVAVAQKYGHRDIDAVDIAAEIADVVKTRFPQSDVNPFLHGNTRQVKADGRAAILHSKEPYDIIQMVHANLHSNAGLLANAWSPSLLETREAFGTYLDHLSDHGTISFGRGFYTPNLARSAAAALMDRGIRRPWEHIAYLKGQAQFILVKKNPWTQTEIGRLEKLAKEMKCKFKWHPGAAPDEQAVDMFYGRALLTDNKPYLDDISLLRYAVTDWFFRGSGHTSALRALYRTLSIQVIFVVVAGILFLFVPLLRRGPTGLSKVNSVGVALTYVACLGYGYLAVETVLIHELILFVGHPTYAVTVVILSMLLFSGIGSIIAGQIKEARLTPTLQLVLLAVFVLASLQAWVFPPLLHKTALGLPMFARLSITFLLLAPLGLVMGMPFPLAMRIIPGSAAGLIPWAWALNGWMSVVASVISILVSRTVGYSESFGIAIAVYLVALGLAPRLREVGRVTIFRAQ